MTASLITETCAKITPLDREVMAQAQARQDVLTKPQGALGRLEILARFWPT